ncbi:MAG: DUF1836 domain-containing protein [bacterium]|nr:DUF1836 domain-containing protein [bacterium]
MFVKRRIQSYLLELSNYNVPNVDALPQMNFYMDQVISYLEDNLKVFEIDDKLITSSMVNNYVKGKVIPAPVNKKYSKVQLTYLLEICSLKNVLSLNEIMNIIDFSTYKDVYTYYKDIQNELVNSVSGSIKKNLSKIKKETEDIELKKLAMELALKANIYKTLSEKIINLLEQKNIEEIEKLKKDLLK